MKKVILFIFILASCKGVSQNKKGSTLSSEAVIKFYKIYSNKAVWFQEMPQFNLDSTNYYFEKATQLLKSNTPIQNDLLADVYLKKGALFVNDITISSADSLAKIGWSYFRKIKDKKKYATLEYDLLSNWASIKLELGEQKKSIELFAKALAVYENNKNPEFEAKVLLDKAIFYERYRLTDEEKLTFQNVKKSHKYYAKFGIKKNPIVFFKIYKTYINYYETKNKDSVYYYSYKMQSLLPYIKNPNVHAWHYVCLGREFITNPIPGNTTISKAQFEQGKKHIVKALQLLEFYHIKSNTIIPYGHGLLADIFFNNNQFDEAIKNYKKSYDGYTYMKNKSASIDMLQYLGRTYEKKGDLATALNYYKKHFDQTLAFQNEKSQRGLRESELKISLLTKDKKLTQNQEQQTIIIIILSILTLLLLALYRNFNLKKKSNQSLAILNDTLENKNNLLDSKNAENELLLREIHHRVKNNLEVVSSLLALQSAQIEDSNTKDAMTEGQNRVNSIGIVHQKLYQGTNLGAVEMKDYFLNLSESILDSFGAEKSIDLKLAMEHLDLDIDTAVPLGLIVNELLTNCIKYAFPKGEKGTITIKLEKQENNILRLEVADNGVGKSGITHGTGFGGQLVSLLTQQLNGTMTEENQNGTTLIFDFKMKAA